MPPAPRWTPRAGLKTVDVGLTAGYLHYWNGHWSSNVVVSPAWVVSEVGDPATANDSLLTTSP